MSGQISYDTSGGPLYHYAEGEIYTGDFEEEQRAPPPASTDDGYLPMDVEYEHPKRQTIMEPLPPRRLSIASSYPSTAGEVPPTLPRPRSELKDDASEPRRPWLSWIGLFGLVGLAGLGGVAVGGSSSSGGPLTTTSGTAKCVVGTVQWSASSAPIADHVVADGSEVDAELYPEFAAAVGKATPNLIGRYARGGLDPGATLDASVDAGSLSIRIFDPGHSHVDQTAYSVKNDGDYSLAHLYSFTTSGINLKESGPAIVASETGITADIDGGSETRPASVILVPYVCVGMRSDF